MLKPGVVQSRYRSHQSTSCSFDVRVAGVGANGFLAELVVVELNLKRLLHVAHGASSPDVEVVGSSLHDRQIVSREKLLHRLRFLRGRRKAGNIFRLQPMMVVGRTAIVERLG